MAENMYANFDLVVIPLLLISIIPYAVFIIKKKPSKVTIAKIDFAYELVITAIVIIRAILAAIIGKSIKTEIFCAICWVIIIVLHFISLKKTEQKE